MDELQNSDWKSLMRGPTPRPSAGGSPWAKPRGVPHGPTWVFASWRLYAILALIWLALVPPLFTRGTCTAEFKAESARVASNAPRWRNSAEALEYWQRRGIPARLITADQCQSSKPRFLSYCGDGSVVYAQVPVSNQVCRWYRDDEIKVQLQFDRHDRLGRAVTEMSPFKKLPIPFSERSVTWAE